MPSPQNVPAEVSASDSKASATVPPDRVAPADALAQQPGAQTLAAVLGTGGLPLLRLLSLARQLALALAALHRTGGVHRRLCPAHIRLPAGEQPAQLAGLGALPAAGGEDQLAGDAEGRLEYIAPEQTGRTAHPVDHRSDLYALGATLYEAATGTPPFGRGDALRLIHDHLVREPVPPHALRPELPQQLSEIILKLLAKEPAQRYQSAEGLSRDLCRLDDALRNGGPLEFPLGEHDFPARLAAPARLLGRRQETAALQAAFDAVVQGPAGGVLVSGPPGVGKTALVGELRRSVAERRGRFVSGKFDASRQDVEADGFYQAMRALGRMLLAEPEQELAALRARALAALGPSRARTVARFPEFGLLLGVQPRTEDFDALRGNDLRVDAMLTFLRALARPERPLVIVVDDLQWAGPLPIGMIHALLTDRALRGLLVVGVHRDTALEARHPLATRLAEWAALPRPPLRIVLGNLQPAAVCELLGEMLRLSPPQASRLAEAIAAATAGNPFDVVELVDGLRREGALQLSQTGWSWDERVIRRRIGQSTVAQLLVARIGMLPQSTRQLLDVLACLGGQVTSSLLELAAGLPAGTAAHHLAAAMEDGLVVANAADPPLVGFAHDRVQQAALDRLQQERRPLHLALARRLQRHEASRLAAAQQYVQALDLITTREEQLAAARLLADAGSHGRSFGAAAAESCLTAAIHLHRLAGSPEASLLPLHVTRHALLYTLARLGEMESLYRHIASLCEGAVQLADSACVQVRSFTHQVRAREGLALGREVLEHLGFPLPAAEQVARLLQDARVFRRWQDPAVVHADMHRPQVRDPRALAAGRLIAAMLAPSASADPQLFASLVLAGQDLWVTHGPAPQFVEAVSSAAFLSILTWEDYHTGHDLVRAVRRISEGRGYPEAVMARFLGVHAAAWHAPLEDLIEEAGRTLHAQLEIGELQTACLTFYSSAHMTLECGSVERWSEEVEAGLAHCRRTSNHHWLPALLPHRQLARMLRGETHAFGSLDDDGFRAAAHEEEIARLPGARTTFHMLQALAAALAGDHAAWLEHASAAAAPRTHVHATYTGMLARLLHALALAQQLQDSREPQRTQLLAQLDASQSWLALRAADAPLNFRHLLRWVQAERAWAMQQPEAALQAFDEAQWLAAQRPRPWHQALLAERAATFLLQRGLRLWGEQTMAIACGKYAAWGAVAKVHQLRTRYPFLATADAALPVRPAGNPPPSQATRDRIDLLGVLRASQALSSNTSLRNLKQTVVELLGAMTGATSVQVALFDGLRQQWLLSASAADGEERLTMEEAVDRRLLPLSAFRYVQRTLQPLVVEDATLDPRFSQDAYFAPLRRCSLLLLPIVHQGAPRAILVLENRLASGAFRGERTDAVLLIAGQLAVSLENALAYEDLEQRVQDRTRELQVAQAELMDTARRAGMAEIATNVLHNVGNVLNSVNVSANVVAARMRGSRLERLARGVDLMQAHAGALGEYLTRDEKGKLLPLYLVKAVDDLEAERKEVISELAHLTESVEHIKNVVATQQSYAGTSSLVESVEMASLVEDALRIHAAAIQKHAVAVRREFGQVRTAQLDKTRVMQILVNLIGNAVQAMEPVAGPRELTVTLEEAGLGVRVRVADLGVGITQENLTRIFSHGFTTRKTGHGFGLHSCALAARELKGTLAASSRGAGLGATFTLELPLALPQA